MRKTVDVEGSVFVITGASSGIGAATARAAHAAGARVVLAARREDRIRELAAELDGAIAVRCDVTDPAQVTALVQAALDAFGRIDVLVNNAGQGLQAGVEQLSLDDFRSVLELNLVAPLALMQAVLPAMRRQGAGNIVNVNSGTTAGAAFDPPERVAVAILELVGSGAARLDLVPVAYGGTR